METYHFILDTYQNNTLYFLIGFSVCLLLIVVIYKIRNRNVIELDGCKCYRLLDVVKNKEAIKSLLLVDKRLAPELKLGEKMICTAGDQKIMVARLYSTQFKGMNNPFEYLYWEI